MEVKSMSVKYISNQNNFNLLNEVQVFKEEHDVVDVRYSIDDSQGISYSALIMYRNK